VNVIGPDEDAPSSSDKRNRLRPIDDAENVELAVILAVQFGENWQIILGLKPRVIG